MKDTIKIYFQKIIIVVEINRLPYLMNVQSNFGIKKNLYLLKKYRPQQLKRLSHRVNFLLHVLINLINYYDLH